MRSLSSRLRRLDDALADLPLDEPMLLTELDGYVTGILVCTDLILPGEWLPVIWSSNDHVGAPFEDPADVQWFSDAVIARYNEIARDLGRGKPRPIFDVDERNGDVLWELWIDGFAEAMALRPDSWGRLSEDEEAEAAFQRLSLLIAVARDESTLDSVEINALHEHAPAAISANVLRLHEVRTSSGEAASINSSMRIPKVGRNDPCPCGSGKKMKRCCD